MLLLLLPAPRQLSPPPWAPSLQLRKALFLLLGPLQSDMPPAPAPCALAYLPPPRQATRSAAHAPTPLLAAASRPQALQAQLTQLSASRARAVHKCKAAQERQRLLTDSLQAALLQHQQLQQAHARGGAPLDEGACKGPEGQRHPVLRALPVSGALCTTASLPCFVITACFTWGKPLHTAARQAAFLCPAVAVRPASWHACPCRHMLLACSACLLNPLGWRPLLPIHHSSLLGRAFNCGPTRIHHCTLGFPRAITSSSKSKTRSCAARNTLACLPAAQNELPLQAQRVCMPWPGTRQPAYLPA